ncbi:hypothetical protein A2Z33_02405 [Candidatus Gottesmanbacteria bacterium RBG_16_52_11]|uniref:FtsK domain-containing protein n=1 Tax=Candidatus Gottesmanbacteria bacterium RBG_16_52_11 TaxID=1798374 RepID=A0A1F5YMJ9_9BACT|nr:MAG: hypothetical protein A2Z33_02405 [Candidatus Gottesmanbacteria bacterium RBG_16_52_11]
MAKKRKYRKRTKYKTKLKKQTVYTVGAIWMWLIAGAITISFFSDNPALVGLRSGMDEKVGWVYYLLPPFLVLLSFLFFKTKSEIGKANVPMGYGILMIALLGLTRAGSVGDSLWGVVSGYVSAEVSVLLFLGIVVIGLIITFNSSLDQLINFIGVGSQSLIDAVARLFIGLFRKREEGIDLTGKGLTKIKSAQDFKSDSKQGPLTVPAGGKAQLAAVPATGKKDIKISAPLNTSAEGLEMWEYPPLTLLSEGPSQKADRGDVKKYVHIIEQTLDSFGIQAEVKEVNKGPAVTQYALRPSMGTKVSKITSLSSDLALALAAPTGQVRIEAPIPGRDLVGIEIPNRGLEFVTLKDMLQSEEMHRTKSKLAVALGLDVSGRHVIADIGRMPHVLIAGTTGSGKSVLVNSWITSLLFRTTPQEVKMILVDPKRVELIGYNGVPHLLTPVIVEPDKILSALRWAMTEMDNRYKQFAEVGVRNIDSFNEMSGFQAMPYIVIFIDELADLMAYAPVEVEDGICRLAQMARATGIHLVLSTQRPSVDVLTGLIKANIPARIAFNVSSMIDSRVIIDMPGAEKLLGRGDMLYIPPDQSKPSRIQGTFVSEAEVNKVVEHMRHKNYPVQYTEEVLTQPLTGWKKGSGGIVGSGGDGKDSLFEDALRLICQHDKASASLLQRRLAVGYARAARILDQLEEAGIIGPGEGSKPRDVLIKNPDDYFARENPGQGAGQ